MKSESRADGSINDLCARAKAVIPGGNSLLSKRREMFAPDQWPTYFEKAKGIVVKDIEGTEYRDFSHFGVGTNTLGYGNEHVDSRVLECIKKGNMCTLNPPEEVYLAEKLVAMHPWASMARFARTGGEANAIAIRIARAHTGRSKIAFCGYHGWHDWYLSANLQDAANLDRQLLAGLSTSGVPKELANTAVPFFDGDLDMLERTLASGDVAAIKMEVMRSKEPSADYLQQIRRLADKYGCVLIFDECTSGFRKTFGGLHLEYGVNPDLCVLGKTLGNGYAITSVIGTGEVMDAAQATFVSSTFFTERIGFVAALATLEEMESLQSWKIITAIGKKFKKRLSEVCADCELKIIVSGMDALAAFAFECDAPQAAKTYLTQEMLSKGFLAGNLFYASVLHSAKDVDEYFNAVTPVLASLSKMLQSGVNPESSLIGDISHSTFQRLN